MAKRKLQQVKPVGRSCGQCNECCTGLGVEELSKQPFAACDKVVDHKCSCYVERPTSCREYKCLWLVGALEGSDRPDRIGVIIDYMEPDEKFSKTVGFPALTARVTRKTEEAEALIQKLSGRFIVRVLDETDKRRVLGPPQAMAQVSRLLPL